MPAQCIACRLILGNKGLRKRILRKALSSHGEQGRQKPICRSTTSTLGSSIQNTAIFVVLSCLALHANCGGKHPCLHGVLYRGLSFSSTGMSMTNPLFQALESVAPSRVVAQSKKQLVRQRAWGWVGGFMFEMSCMRLDGSPGGFGSGAPDSFQQQGSHYYEMRKNQNNGTFIFDPNHRFINRTY